MVLAGNKVDEPTTGAGADPAEDGGTVARAAAALAAAERRLAAAAPVCAAFPTTVVACLEASAARPAAVAELFLTAHRLVLHPVAPLVNLARAGRSGAASGAGESAGRGASSLRPLAARAFRRIFRRFDADCDGLLSSEELRDFQVRGH